MGEVRSYPLVGDDPGLRDALVAAQLPIDDITEPGRCFFRFESEGVPVGYAGYEPLGPDAMLRSVVVLPEARGRGIGRAIAEAVIAEAGRNGAVHAFLLTTDAAAFFARLGFAEIARSEAPDTILATRQATTICTTAALLKRTIARA